MLKKGLYLSMILLFTVSTVVGCSRPTQIEGKITIDGSSTVYPISQAVAEEFMIENQQFQVTVQESGTGGGFKKFSQGETDINDASRPIKDGEKELAKQQGIDAIELPVAYDGISIVVNKANDFVDSLTIEELKKIWEPGSQVKTWNDVRPEWPKEEIKLYGPGTASGTFDYFTEVIMGEEGKTRTDYTPSEDDNVLVKGVAGDKYSLGYFGYAYYAENKDQLKIVKVDAGKSPIEPTLQTIKDGIYHLSRPVFIYVSSVSLERPEVKAFVEYYLTTAKQLVTEVGYVPLQDEEYQKSLDLIAQ